MFKKHPVLSIWKGPDAFWGRYKWGRLVRIVLARWFSRGTIPSVGYDDLRNVSTLFSAKGLKLGSSRNENTLFLQNTVI
ncbi:hypothetical protein [Paenibacillus sp. Soil724D2]|uniref:hypothetical protein n=1 Tax=Paenibacillus sp. (strain Soil724D2) TaxID=1736392 RepID=UPI000713D6BE|nr:hypothetical protein [Paenibacillus sp. Soil724D2]KRE47434.1 hypothetical protein ASG85_27200 [Paenibacillus sp. Soil724D2]